MEWPDLVFRCSVTHRTNESIAEYLASPKTRQAEIKDIGGFIGAYLEGGRRGKNNVVHKQLIMLDADHDPKSLLEDFPMIFDCNALIYSTHKHTPENPRLRLIIPLDRPVTPLEHGPIIRKIAGILGIEQFDHTSFEINRMMYLPSTAKDGEYVFQEFEGDYLSADSILSQYTNWKDASSWPMSERETKAIQAGAKKQGDPTEKEGLVGAFCRIYDVESAIEEFLSDVYEKCDVEGRYTYTGGTTAAGLVIHDGGKFAFSHHSTDPVSGKLCNAFDLVRLHKFGDLDENAKEETPGNRLPSFTAMVDWVGKNKEVVKLLAREKLEEAGLDFSPYTEVPTEEVEQETDWLGELDMDRKGNILSTIGNVVKILQFDPNLKGCLALDLFEKREVALRDLPWRKVDRNTKYLNDSDDSNLRNYLESVYGICSGPKVKDGEDITVNRNGFHPVRDYLDSLVWDGVDRLDRILIDYLGAEDTEYTRAVIRKSLAAAVTRIYRPGSKFDYVLTLVGDEGLKKSSLIAALGGAWFSDSFGDVEKTKEAMESLQGVWLMEIGELAGMKKASAETIKHFISKRDDRYRVAYGRRMEYFPRQCIFFATTNEMDFLKGNTGNRRFWPVKANKDKIIKNPLTDLVGYERDQIWAEAVELYLAGEPLYLSEELEAVAREIQADHSEKDERVGLIQKYLDTLLPTNWESMGTYERRSYIDCISTPSDLMPEGTVQRSRVCAAEIWVELFGGNQKDMNAHNTRFIHDTMRKLAGWEQYKSRTMFKGYGNQIGYFKVEKDTTVASKFTTVGAGNTTVRLQ